MADEQVLETPYVEDGELICEGDVIDLMPGTVIDVPDIDKIRPLTTNDNETDYPGYCVACGQEVIVGPEWAFTEGSYSHIHLSDGTAHAVGRELCFRCKAPIPLQGHHCNHAVSLIIPSHFHGAAVKIETPYRL